MSKNLAYLQIDNFADLGEEVTRLEREKGCGADVSVDYKIFFEYEFCVE